MVGSNNKLFSLTEQAKEWCLEYGLPIATHDFLGYIIRVTRKESCLVGIDGSIFPISSDERHPYLSSRRVKKVFKALFKSYFIVPKQDEPFEELANSVDLPFDFEKANKIPIYLFGGKDIEVVGADDNTQELERAVEWLYGINKE